MNVVNNKWIGQRTIRPDGALADPFVVDDVHRAVSRISAAVSITARTILS